MTRDPAPLCRLGAALAVWGLSVAGGLAQTVEAPPPPPVTAPAAEAAPAPFTFFSMGSGEVTGGYYDVADALCEVVNRLERNRLRCSPEATQGSLYNLAALRDGQLEFALVQSDWQRHAYEGTLAFAASGPMGGLRSVMALYPEALTILARRSAGMTSIADLRGHWVDLGPPASGRHATAKAVLTAAGIGRANVAGFVELPIGAAYDELCHGHVDASLLILGHPNPRLADVMARCDLEILPFDGEMARRYLEAYPDYSAARIAAGTYPGLTGDLGTIAVTATIVTRADVDGFLVTRLVQHTLAELPLLRATRPILAGLDPAGMAADGLTAPLHPAAAAAFGSHRPTSGR